MSHNKQSLSENDKSSRHPIPMAVRIWRAEALAALARVKSYSTPATELQVGKDLVSHISGRFDPLVFVYILHVEKIAILLVQRQSIDVEDELFRRKSMHLKQKHSPEA